MSIVTLQDAKTWLRFPAPSQVSADDAVIQSILDACTSVVEEFTGPILPRVVTETHDGGNCEIFLRQPPIISVDEVQESWGYIVYDLDLTDAMSIPLTMFCYSVDDYETGQVTRRTAGNVVIPFMGGVRNLTVTYTAGRSDAVPGAQMAVKELTAHVYQGSLQRSVSMAGANIAYDAVMGMSITDGSSGVTYYLGLPSRVFSWLELGNKRMPFFA